MAVKFDDLVDLKKQLKAIKFDDIVPSQSEKEITVLKKKLADIIEAQLEAGKSNQTALKSIAGALVTANNNQGAKQSASMKILLVENRGCASSGQR